MMRFQTYAGLSFISTIVTIYHAFHSRQQFYPAMVYLSTSKICFVLLLNMGFVFMCILWKLVQRLFLGTLREAEVERLNEQAWREVMEILFAITIFRQDFSVTSLGMVTALLLIKALHWLVQKRVEYIETTPSVSLLSHIRIVSFMVFLFIVDFLFWQNSFKSLLQMRIASLTLFFAFEYTILASTTISTFVKYVFYVTDMLMEGQWEKKAMFTFYLELVRDLFHLTLYICFFLVICAHHNAPLHLIRELYETFRSFKTRVADYMRYRKVTSNMNERFPDATPEELTTSDATCIICREEMVTAKKLLCGHFFHVHCLRSWLERQNTCPTCRALVVPPENAQAGSTRNEIPQNRQAGLTATSNPAGDNLSQHQLRLQAASLAASIYGKSSIYPSANTPYGSSGYSLLPQLNIPSTLGIKESCGESTPGSAKLDRFSVSNGYSQGSTTEAPIFRGLENYDLEVLKACEASIHSRIEEILRRNELALRQELENRLQASQQQKGHPKSSDVVDGKGKAIATD